MTTLVYNQLSVYLYLSLFLLFCGIVGVLYRRTLIGMLVSMELIMNGAGLNLIALNRFLVPENPHGMAFTLIIMGIAAAEAALALSIIIVIFRKHRNIDGDRFHDLRE